MLQQFENWLLDFNYRRLLRRKLKRLNALADDCSADESLVDNTLLSSTFPKIRTVLVVDPLHCFGDSLYVNALLHRVKEDSPSVELTVLTEQHLFASYKSTDCRLLDFRSKEDLNNAIDESFDLILDLDYKDDGEWSFRRSFYGQRKACVVTLSPVVSQAKIFTACLDLSGVVHFGLRMGRVAQFIKAAVDGKCTISENKKVLFPKTGDLFLKPCVEVARTSDNDACIYVNTQGQKAERVFSATQVKALADWFDNQTNYTGLFYIGNANYPIYETDRVKFVRTSSFLEAVSLAASCRGIVTPDTSMVHVASALDVPVLAVYALGKKEYPSGKDQSEVWAPVGSSVVVCKKWCHDLSDLSIDRFISSFKSFVRNLEKS